MSCHKYQGHIRSFGALFSKLASDSKTAPHRTKIWAFCAHVVYIHGVWVVLRLAILGSFDALFSNFGYNSKTAHYGAEFGPLLCKLP